MLYDYMRYDGESQKILDSAFDQMRQNKRHPIYVSGLCTGASDALLCLYTDEFYKKTRKPSLILCHNEKECARISAMLSEQGMKFPYYRARDFVFNNISASHTDECERIRILYSLLSSECGGVVTTPSALLQYTIPADVLCNNILALELGAEYDPSYIVKKLL